MFTVECLQRFSKNYCIICKDESEDRKYTYDEVIKVVKQLCQQFRSLGVSESVCFGVRPKDGHTAGSVALLIAILNYRCHFCPLQDHENNAEISVFLANCGASYLVSNDVLAYQQIATINIFDEIFNLYSVLNDSFKIMLPANMCYSIGTSGSTERPKIVHVPYDCIAPNIKSLCAQFKIGSHDIIYLGTPITFDPFVVEFFMALSSGAALLIVPHKLRLAPQKLADLLWPRQCSTLSATILQMTPSLFRQFGADTIRDTILAKSSPLRILILGGEEFPKSRETKKWLPHDGVWNTRIFNIYGITEMSCWSTIHELNAVEVLENGCTPLGKPIDDETTLHITEIAEECVDGIQRGELLIGSATRKTFIPQVDNNDLSHNDYGNGEGIFYRSTGDYVERSSRGEMYYLGRLNNVVKRMGKRINLDVLERKIEALFPTIEDLKVVCLFKKSTQTLICCLKCHAETENSESWTNIKRKIMQNLSNYEKPDWMVQVEKVPLNKHGKMDRRKLLEEIVRTEVSQPVNIFRSFLTSTLQIDDFYRSNTLNTLALKRRKLSSDDPNTIKSFTSLGGTSFHALSLATEIGKYLANSNDQRELLEKFLDPDIAVEDILIFLENVQTCPSVQQSQATLQPANSTTRRLKFLWRVDLGKCVDATPAVDFEKRYICIGSHAHLLITVDATNGQEVCRWKLRSRIECEATFVLPDLALIGCNAGYLYAFNFKSGELFWDLYIGRKVKAKPLAIDMTHAIIGCYDEEFNLVYICLKTPNIDWRRKVGVKPIFSSPMRLDKETALICTLDGTYERIVVNTGNALWTRKCSSPIFSTPAIIEKDVTFGIAEVGGKVHICKTENGDIFTIFYTPIPRLARYVPKVSRITNQLFSYKSERIRSDRYSFSPYSELQSFSVEGNVFSNLTVHRVGEATIKLILGSHDHHVYCLNYIQNVVGETKELNFNLNWKTAMNAAVYASPIVAKLENEHYVIVCSTDGVLSILDLATGSAVVTNKLGGEVFSTPCSIQNLNGRFRIYFGCRDNFLYCFQFY